jgi:hypothetical protein
MDPYWLPGLITLAWSGVLVARGRVPLPLLALAFGLCVLCVVAGAALGDAAGSDPSFSGGRASDWGWDSGTASDVGFLLVLNGFTAGAWCGVLGLVTLPVNALRERRERASEQHRFLRLR